MKSINSTVQNIPVKPVKFPFSELELSNLILLAEIDYSVLMDKLLYYSLRGYSILDYRIKKIEVTVGIVNFYQLILCSEDVMRTVSPKYDRDYFFMIKDRIDQPSSGYYFDSHSEVA